jgi:squalene-hopene/tetraprenyl-beta-curcumene cyclase
MTRSSLFVAASLCLVLLAPLSAGQRGGSGAAGLSAATRQELMKSLASGATYLRAQQRADGTFDENPGVSAVAAAALLRQPGVPQEMLMDAGGRKALDAIAKLAKPDGGIYDKIVPHYITAVSVMALVAGGRPQDKPLIEKGRAYLTEHIWDEGEGIKPNDKWYGGIGYGGSNPDRRADIISLEYALRAMKEAELPANDAAWEKAIKFLQRTQNNSETNDQGWASNDGGFVYYPGFTYHTEGGTKSYGSATYAGVISYAWANVKKEDARVQAVLKWVRDNYTVDENPGMGQKTVYYYYLVFAKALQAVGTPTIVDAKGRSHNWREDLAKKLISLQHPEGYWVNTDKAELQDNKVLVTAFTLQAIEAALQP